MKNIFIILMIVSIPVISYEYNAYKIIYDSVSQRKLTEKILQSCLSNYKSMIKKLSSHEDKSEYIELELIRLKKDYQYIQDALEHIKI